MKRTVHVIVRAGRQTPLQQFWLVSAHPGFDPHAFLTTVARESKGDPDKAVSAIRAATFSSAYGDIKKGDPVFTPAADLSAPAAEQIVLLCDRGATRIRVGRPPPKSDS